MELGQINNKAKILTKNSCKTKINIYLIQLDNHATKDPIKTNQT